MVKLKKVAKANIMSSHLTLIVACFCSLEMFLWYSLSFGLHINHYGFR
jgi:hypothetical protein